MTTARGYAAFLGAEYLSEYVAGGGAAVKFVVPPDDDTAQDLSAHLLEVSTARGYASARVDAVTTRIHLMDQLFFDIARQVDWRSLARVAIRDAVTAAGFPPASGSDGADALAIDALAAHHAMDVNELTRDVNRELQQRIMRDYAMAQEFRVAMLRLCQAELATGQVTEAERDAVVAWLCGELRQMSMLRSAMIFRRIGRHNATRCCSRWRTGSA